MKYIKIIGIVSSLLLLLTFVIIGLFNLEILYSKSFEELTDFELPLICQICKILFLCSISFYFLKERLIKIRVYLIILIAINILWILFIIIDQQVLVPFLNILFLVEIIIFFIFSIKIFKLKEEKEHIFKTLKEYIISMLIAYVISFIIMISLGINQNLILYYKIISGLLMFLHSVPYVFGILFFIRIGEQVKKANQHF